MNAEILQQAINLFDTPGKWNAFTELANHRDEIEQGWWKKLQLEVYHREIATCNPDWDIYIWNNWDIMWFIRGETNSSLAVHFWGNGFRVFQGYGALDIEKVNHLLSQETKFNLIKTCFARLDGSNRDTIGWENRNFSFGTPFDGYFPDNRILGWYAGHRTQEFADQLIQKVRKFQTPETTQLFREINERCRKG